MQNPEEVAGKEVTEKVDESKPKIINDFDKNIMKFKERKNMKLKVEPPWSGPEDSSSPQNNTISLSEFPKTATGK